MYRRRESLILWRIFSNAHCSQVKAWSTVKKIWIVSRGRILGRNRDKSVPSLLFTVTSTALPWDFYFFKLSQPLTYFFKLMQPLTISKEKRGKHDRNPYLLPYVLRKPYTETSSFRTFKIMPRKLKEIVRSWIWLQDAHKGAQHMLPACYVKYLISVNLL